MISLDDWRRYERYVGEIFGALGMEMNAPGVPRHAEAVPAGASRCDCGL